MLKSKILTIENSVIAAHATISWENLRVLSPGLTPAGVTLTASHMPSGISL